MKIEIINAFSLNGTEFYRWELFDGPDGIEHVKGFAVDLPSAFAKICEWREKISREYYEEQTNETF